MTEGLSADIRRVLVRHDIYTDLPQECWCGHRFDDAALANNEPVWERHVAEEILAAITPRLAAYTKLCISSGDMTPTAQRMLMTILEGR